MKIEISPTAGRQISDFVTWWDEHRPAARVRVEDALASALETIAEHPELGRRYAAPVPHLALEGNYLLFYRLDQAADTILIAVAWSAMRGASPKLP